MNIQNINNTNFQGGYLCQGVPKVAKSAFYTWPKGRIVRHIDNDQLFIAAKDQLHPLVADWVHQFGIKCTYYPNFKMNMISPNTQRETIEELIKTQKTAEIVFDETTQKAAENKRTRMYMQNHRREYAANITRTLSFDIDLSSFKSKFGAIMYKNATHTKRILISPPKENVIYVRVRNLLSSSSQESEKMYKMTPEGEFLEKGCENTSEKKSKFLEEFDSALIKPNKK